MVLTDYPSSHSDSAKAPEKDSQDDTGENLLNDSDTDLKNVPRNDLEGVDSENQESVPTEPNCPCCFVQNRKSGLSAIEITTESDA